MRSGVRCFMRTCVCVCVCVCVRVCRPGPKALFRVTLHLVLSQRQKLLKMVEYTEVIHFLQHEYVQMCVRAHCASCVLPS